MVATLFMLALLSFALMGLFVVALTIYSGLAARRRRVEELAAGLDAEFEGRRRLAADVEALLRKPAPELADRARAGAAAPPAVGTALHERADADRRVALTLHEVLARANAMLAGDPAVDVFLERLDATDTKVAAAGRGYNAAVNEYNGACALFPSMFVARVSGMAPRPLIRVADGPRHEPAAPGGHGPR